MANVPPVPQAKEEVQKVRNSSLPFITETVGQKRSDNCNLSMYAR